MGTTSVKSYESFDIIYSEYHIRFKSSDDTYALFLKDFLYLNTAAQFNIDYSNCDFLNSFS